MKIYIDGDYKCHVTDDGTMRAVETDFFVGRCSEFIEGYRYVPAGETWTRADGEVFNGEMIAPWRDYSQISEIQTAVDRAQAQAQQTINEAQQTINEAQQTINEYEAALSEIETALGVTS